ncbi:CGGC domain-containing protein [Dethiobacter alkaliphilus]|uniref:CGGC domain-containing protein n=1 Tax=Dethiobacter alkaliphilus TaxID=427926 RepID=UPI002227F8B8|nr:CGGC domain-containing protein [Dethiobacter alkaliphilus]MCW3489224.1 CGGC domain-containing protein [Dethiobacter alkaliphilus]
MARIGILTCSNATGELGCSSVSCLRDLRKREGEFSRYVDEDKLDLVGMISCSGCPTVVGPSKLLQRIRALTEFRIDAIHLSYCVVALCPFRNKYIEALKAEFPGVEIIEGTHAPHITHEEFREEVRELFCQPRRTMIDVILGRKNS